MRADSEAPDVTSGRAGLNDAQLQARVFTILWAIAHIAHMLRKGGSEAPLMWLVLLAALVLIARPSSRWRLTFLAGAELLYAFSELPRIDNHLLIMSAVNLGLLVSVGISLLPRSTSTDAAPPWDALPYARLVLLVAYGAAAIAKLNEGFFDTTHSCAIGLFEDTASVFGSAGSSLVDVVSPALPYVVTAAELAIPILLLVPATRLIGVSATIVFHLAMTVSPTARAGLGFTFVLLALVFLFLPTPAAAHVEHRSRTLARRFHMDQWNRNVVLVVMALLIAVLASRELIEFTTVEDNGNWLVLAPVAAALGVLLLEVAWQASRHHWTRSLTFRPRHAAYFVLIGLVVLNAASPYLGGKTITSFTMYSNLQTDRGESNHFFLPRVSLASGQDDVVEILDSSVAELRRARNADARITWHELRRQLTANPTASVRYVRAGVVFDYAEARENPDLVDLDPLSAKVLAYRWIDPDAPKCRW